MIELIRVSKIYHPEDRNRVVALDRVSLEIPDGRFVAVMGRSGSGKSTLLNLMGGLDVPTEGDILVDGANIARLSEKGLTAFRREKVGIVFQFYNLLPVLTVRENIALPGLIGGRPRRVVLARADALLEEVGLLHRQAHRPDELSGGEMQRAAIARALINDPSLILADEPTGNLDSRSADRVLSSLRSLSERHGKTVVMVTHSREAAACADRLVVMKDGAVHEETLAAL
ncbi:MAG: ABC transporter ATP-binding protein [Armatimonadetes bacterium]|nr:ABC transporter ATP-binding protein [Armatimonadota bacterium]